MIRPLAPTELTADQQSLPDGIVAMGAFAEQPGAHGLWIAREAERTGTGKLVRTCGALEPALALVAWAADEARRLGARALQVGVMDAPGLGDALAARGYRVVESFVTLRRVGGPRACPPLPEGHRERTLADLGDARYLEIANAAFDGVPGSFPLTPADFARVRTEPGFVESLVRVVEDRDGPVGFLRGSLAPGHAGEVDAIGLLPRARGRGLGRYLLRRCEELLDEAGAPSVQLLVAASNANAYALYLKDGYAEIARRDSWEAAL